MKHASMLLLALSPVFAAGDNLILVAGQIQCVGYLAPSSSNAGLRVQGEGSAVHVLAPSGRASLTLSLRTNCGYRLLATNRGSAHVQVVKGSVSAAAGMGHLTPLALEASVIPAELGGGKVTECARGQRVSQGGNNLTPDNAIVIQIVLESDGPKETVVNFALDLAAKN